MAHGLPVIALESAGTSRYPPLLIVHGAGHGAWCWAEHFLGFFADRGFDANVLEPARPRQGARARPAGVDVRCGLRGRRRAGCGGQPREPVVVGHSLVGLVVQQYLVRHDPPPTALLASAPPEGCSATRRGCFRTTLGRCYSAFLNGDPAKLFSTPEHARRFLFSPDLGE